jgi:putative ABC transport system substrate-binding protein
MPVSPDAAANNVEAFRQGLRDLGYVEGRSVALEYRYARGRDETLAGLAIELVRLNVDLIVTWGTPATRAAKQATTSIPIVMAAIADPIGTGIVTNLGRPGGNVTGVTSISLDLEAKRLELLKTVRPQIVRVATIWNPSNPVSALILKQTQAAAETLRIELLPVGVKAAEEFADGFAAIARHRPDALSVQPEVLLLDHRTRILAFVAANGLPAIYGYREFVDAGGLMFYGPHWPDLFRRSATHVDRILKGSRPGDLPIEQPTKFEFVVNLKAARALGLTVPQTLLLRADQVIQ